MFTAGFGPAKPRKTKKLSRRVELVVIMQERTALNELPSK
jgi:hypothetical protein